MLRFHIDVCSTNFIVALQTTSSWEDSVPIFLISSMVHSLIVFFPSYKLLVQEIRIFHPT